VKQTGKQKPSKWGWNIGVKLKQNKQALKTKAKEQLQETMDSKTTENKPQTKRSWKMK
jgi:hypothetical protein